MRPLILRFFAFFTVGLILFCAPFSSALAHAIVVSSEPAVNAVLESDTVNFSVRFNSRIDKQRSKITLIHPDNSQTRLPIIENENPTILSATGDHLIAGAYHLRWQVLSVDGHITRGDIPFSIKR